MMKKLLILCLALMLPWTCAAADAFSVKVTVSAAGAATEADLLAARFPDGSMYGSISLDGDRYAAAMDPTLGLLLQDSDGEWRQITAFGAPLTLLALGSFAADHREDADDFGDRILRDLATISSRLSAATKDSAVMDRFTGLWLDLIQNGSVTITGTDLSSAVTGAADVWLNALFTGAAVTRDGNTISITLPGDVPESLTSLEMGDMYADLWRRLVPAEGLTLILPDLPVFTLTVAYDDDSLTVSLACDAITLDITFAADLSVFGIRFSGSGSTANGSFSFSGAVGLNGINCTITTEASVLDARITFGTYASASVQHTLTGHTDPVFTLYAAFGPSSCTLNAVTPLYAITATASEDTLDASVRDRDASVLATPLVRLTARMSASSFSFSLNTPEVSDSLAASWQQFGGNVTLSRYNYRTGQSATGLLTWTDTYGQFTLTGSLALPDRQAVASTLTIFTNPFTGGELTINFDGEVRRLTVSCQQPSPDNLQLTLRDSCTGSRNYSRSITALWTTWTDYNRLDLSWDDSASGNMPLTAFIIFTPGNGNPATVNLEAFNGDVTVFQGSADLTVEGSRKVLSGTISLPDASPLSVLLEIDTDPAVSAPSWPRKPAQIDLFR